MSLFAASLKLESVDSSRKCHKAVHFSDRRLQDPFQHPPGAFHTMLVI